MFRNTMPRLTSSRQLVSWGAWLGVAAVLLTIGMLQTGSPAWLRLLDGALVGVAVATVAVLFHRWRYWKRRPRLAGLFVEIGDQVPRMFARGLPRNGSPAGPVDYRLLSNDGDVFLAIRRSGRRAFIVTRYTDADMERFEEEIEARGTGVLISDSFIVSRGQVVLCAHGADAARYDTVTGDLAPANPPPPLSRRQRARVGWALWRAGYLYLTEADAEELARQLAAAKPMLPRRTS